jgi:crotonobetainyl-CoA:carnitine CoA-transferase CaiB-like acyl-CoA transferase
MVQAVAVEGMPDVPVVGPAAKLSRTPVGVRHRAPALGAHSDEILDELGIDPEARARLRREAAIE